MGDKLDMPAELLLMAEPLLVNLDMTEFNRLHRDAERGSETARETIIHLWDDAFAERAANHQEIACFLCSSTDCLPPFMQLYPERCLDNELMLAASLCVQCRELSVFLRMGRGLRTLRRMWTGQRKGRKRSVSFTFNPRATTHPK
jgi:hypothetical protein